MRRKENREAKMGGHGAIEVAKTVLEVADVAWTAMEVTHHHHHHNQSHENGKKSPPLIDVELENLRAENRRLRNTLEHNLKLLHNLSQSPYFINDCPPDLYARIVATVDSEHFMTRLKNLQQASANRASIEFPFKEATGDDLQSVEILVNVDNKEPSWWVWVTDEMVPGKVEERCGIDNESYVIVSEEHVVDGVANFMAKCIVSNPNAQKFTPEELQKTVAKALGGVSKLEKVLNIWHAGTLFYALSTWGLALAGLYQSRGMLKIAARGVHATSRVVMKAL